MRALSTATEHALYNTFRSAAQDSAEMGSVGQGGRCLLCGNVGGGGYSCDHIGYPTCEVCNTKERGVFNGFTATQIKMDQIRSIMGSQPSRLNTALEVGGTLRRVASFLVPGKDHTDMHLYG